MNDAVLLKIYLVETDKHKWKSLYGAIAIEARKMVLAGIVVYRGIFGYGESGKIRTAKILDLSWNLPLIIEMVDNKEKIQMMRDYLTGIKSNVRIVLHDVKTTRM